MPIESIANIKQIFRIKETTSRKAAAVVACVATFDFHVPPRATVQGAFADVGDVWSHFPVLSANFHGLHDAFLINFWRFFKHVTCRGSCRGPCYTSVTVELHNSSSNPRGAPSVKSDVWE